MYLLYLDESGNEDDPADKFFVLAGLAVFERTTYFLSQDLEKIQNAFFPSSQPIPFHAGHIRSGKGFWRDIDKDKRTAVLKVLSETIANANEPGVCLFAAAVEKGPLLYGEDAILNATEQICKRFDTFLVRRETEANDPQRGLLIFSEGRFDKRAKIWVKEFRELGTQWGSVKNLSDIPYFASMVETRLLQVADIVAYSVFQLYEKRDPTFIAPFIRRFHYKEGVLHGLVHIRANTSISCDCPACRSRLSHGDLGNWVS